jgi:hypothetical protein
MLLYKPIKRKFIHKSHAINGDGSNQTKISPSEANQLLANNPELKFTFSQTNQP